MRGRRLLGALALGAITAAAAAPARAAGGPVVAVLYFDNNTGDKELDVLQKGFADMMITDLAGVEGIVVVERERLQALLDEMSLQKSKYFDAKTALKLGKGLGATYAVTGSFAAMKPQLRIDLRMIEIATGKVVLTTKVQGPATALFDLEQDLVGKFVTGLKLTFTPAAQPRTKVPDVKTLVEYSHGIDLADHGKLEPASQKMASVVRMAPAFALARIRRDELVRRLEEAKSRREQLISAGGEQLFQNAQAFLKAHKLAGASKDDAKLYLAYRVVRGRYLMRRLKEHVSDKNLSIPLLGHEAQALAAMKAYVDNAVLLVKEIDVYAGAHTQVFPNGLVYLDTSYSLPPDDDRRARESDFSDSIRADPVWTRHALARFLLLGYGDDGSDKSITVAPPLANLEARYAKVGFTLLADAFAVADAKVKTDPRQDYPAVEVLETWGEVLVFHGKPDEGIAKWQEVLDRYPTSSQFERIERHIKEELGIDSSHTNRELTRYAKGLKGCDDMDLRVGLDTVSYRRMRMRGLQALHEIVAEIEKACKSNPNARSFWNYLYSHTALQFGGYSRCKEFEDYMRRSVAAGGSAGDVIGWRKNYTKCPIPLGTP